jgi:hypothetical protein
VVTRRRRKKKEEKEKKEEDEEEEEEEKNWKKHMKSNIENRVLQGLERANEVHHRVDGRGIILQAWR